MPGFNGTGPRGLGPATGWGRGTCGANRRKGNAGNLNQALGGFGPQAGFWGRPRWGQRFISNSRRGRTSEGYATPEAEIRFLKERKAHIQEELETIQNRLAELESQT